MDEITKNEIKRFKPDIVGITSTTATFFDVKNNLLNLIRSIDKNIKIVLGGPHASALPEEILSKCSDIDIICRGEGEIALLDIAKGTALEGYSRIILQGRSRHLLKQGQGSLSCY